MTELLEETSNQAHQMTIAPGPGVSPEEVGHWYSPDRVAMLIDAECEALEQEVSVLLNYRNILRRAIIRTLDANAHLADGDNCTLLDLKLALVAIGTPWEGDEMNGEPNKCV